jgi:hypothetical protein
MNGIMLSDVMLNVIRLSVVMLSVVLLNGVAQVIKKSRRVHDIHHNSQCSYAGYRILFLLG